MIEIGLQGHVKESNIFQISGTSIQGDLNALRLLNCLTYIVALYGEQFVLLQYFPHMVEVVGRSCCPPAPAAPAAVPAAAAAAGTIPLLLEGGLIGACSLFLAVISYLQVIIH